VFAGDGSVLGELAQIAQAMGTSTEDILDRLRSDAAEAQALAKRHQRLQALPVFYGPSAVARWCGVGRAAVSNWLQRYDDFPEPAGVVRGAARDAFFWRGDQREDWIRWAHGPEPVRDTVPGKLVDWPE
jgi:hypothetical protein